MQLVMFDVDGTLVDSNQLDRVLYAQAVRELVGVEVDRTWQSYRHVTDSGVLEDVLEQCAPSIDAAELTARVKDRLVELVSEQLRDSDSVLDAIPGASQLVDRLRASPYVTVAIATGGWKETAELKLSSAGIDFGGLPFASASDAASRVEIMRLAEQRAGACSRFTRKTYFGDAPWDQRASAELRYHFVGVGMHVEHSIAFDDLTDQEAILSLLGV